MNAHRHIINSVAIDWAHDNKNAAFWKRKIEAHIKKRHPRVAFKKASDAVIVLGGDGTILKCARKYQKTGAVILGLNLGTVGFLASVRDSRSFLSALDRFLRGNFTIMERMMMEVRVMRGKKTLFESNVMNEVVIQNPLGIMELEARIDNHLIQRIRGNGVLIATSTGSTGINLSAHGPIVMPDIKAMILTELLDHDIPTPSLVVKRDRTIACTVSSFRRRNLLKIARGGKYANALVSVDGSSIFPLEKGDIVVVSPSPDSVKFAELEKNYFFKSLHEQFGFQ